MMLVVVPLLVDISKIITLNNPEAIKISYPNFFRDLDYLLNNPDMKG
ncbi:hypothetical protein [Oenococcus oeni]|nr:hypothetical protein [Oenococcus oeni]